MSQKIEEIEVRDFPHKDDWYLKLVLGKIGNEYGTWEKNIDRVEPSYNMGHYFNTLEEAKADFEERSQRLGI